MDNFQPGDDPQGCLARAMNGDIFKKMENGLLEKQIQCLKLVIYYYILYI